MSKLLRDFVRIENDFTIIPNEVLRNKEMKSSTKNILLTMFSLPPSWDFSIAGIATCVYEGRETVQKALVELEKIGYITRTRDRRENGTLGAMIYTIHQFPVSEEKNTYKKNFPNQHVKNQQQVKQVLDSETQLRTNNNKELNNNTTPSPTELNIFSKEKGYSPSGLNTSLSEERAEKRSKRENNKFKWVVVKNHIISSMEKLGYDSTSEETENAVEVFRYYYMEFKRKTGHNHPNLNDKTMRSVLERFLEGTEEIAGGDADEHMAVIEEHFCDDTHYGMDIDWNIQHFMTEDIRNYLHHRVK